MIKNLTKDDIRSAFSNDSELELQDMKKHKGGVTLEVRHTNGQETEFEFDGEKLVVSRNDCLFNAGIMLACKDSFSFFDYEKYKIDLLHNYVNDCYDKSKRTFLSILIYQVQTYLVIKNFLDIY